MRLSSQITSRSITTKLDEISLELSEIGIDYVGHGVVDKKGEHTGYFSDKEWGKLYIEKGYFYKDPVLDVFDLSPLKIIDWKMVQNILKENEILAERTQYTGVISGLTLVSRTKEYLEFLNLGFRKKICSTQYLLEKRLLLQGYVSLYRQHHTYQR